jgi:hypothetical protein
VYSIAHSRESKALPVLRQLDVARFPRDLDEGPAPSRKPELPLSKSTPLHAKSADRITTLVVYTANALAVAGSQAALDALIQQSFSDLNQGFQNSDVVSIMVENVMPGGANGAQVVYGENPGITNVATRWYAHRTFARTDPTIQGLRTSNEADIVVMLVGDAGVCGVAYTQRPDCGSAAGELGCDVGPQYNGFAESVVSTACAAQTLTIPHEVCHQFGMEHDRPNGAAAGAASFLWSYGYTVSTPTVHARTIMAYDLPAACPNGCPVFLHYSNPNVNFLSFPTTPTGTTIVDGTNRWTFNARTASLLAPDMANFMGPGVFDRIFRGDFEALPDLP